MTERQYAVVEETADRSLIQLIGIYNNAAEAYGEAVMYLSDLAEEGTDVYRLSTLKPLCSGGGYSIDLLDKDDNPITTVYVLYKVV